MNNVQVKPYVVYLEPDGYDMDQIGRVDGDNSLPMLIWEDSVGHERWFKGPVQMSLRAGLVSLISIINFYANQGLTVIQIDFDNQTLLWMHNMKTKVGDTFLTTCIQILQKQNQITFDGKHTMHLKNLVRLA